MSLLDFPGKHRVKRLWNYFVFSTLGILYMVSVTLYSKLLLFSPLRGFFYRNGLTDRYTLGFMLSTKIIWGKLAEVMHENSFKEIRSEIKEQEILSFLHISLKYFYYTYHHSI